MPTGYIAQIIEKEGFTFNQFAMTCARAFGACVEMRDDPMDAPIPEEFKPSGYSKHKAVEARAAVSQLIAMSEEEQRNFGIKAKCERITMFVGMMARDEEENAKLGAIEKEVLAWVPPTEDHVEFKHFMLDQIKISKHDLDYWRGEIERAEEALPEDMYKAAVEKAVNDVDYHEKEEQADIERSRSRTQWMKQLRESLK